MRWRATGIAIALWIGMACGGSAPPPDKPDPPGDGGETLPATGFRFVVEPPDAEVVVDGEVIGTAADLSSAVAYPSGIHQILVRKPGFQTWRAEVAVRDQVEMIAVTLEPTPE